jgi:hypothetical protein
MSAYDEFYEMAREMLSDPEICSHAKLLIKGTGPQNPSKPWEPPKVETTVHDVTCFYYKPKNNMVNGTVIATGQKAVLVQTEVSEASLLLATWKDNAGKEWLIKTYEKVELNDKPIYYKLLIGT